MADIDGLQDFARSNFEGLTAPLDSSQVEAMVKHWLPEMRFFEEEHFYPVALRQVVRQVEREFADLPEPERDSFRVPIVVRSDDGSGPWIPEGTVQTFDPPVLCVPDGVARIEGPTGEEERDAWRILSSGPLGSALELEDVDDDALLTHGGSFRRSDTYFGPVRRLSDAIGAPFRPRLEPMTVIAVFLNLLEALKYELLTQEADDYPPDGLRGGLDIAGELLVQEVAGSETPVLPGLSRPVLLKLIEAFQDDDPGVFRAALDDLPSGWSLRKNAWDAVTRFAFVEYSFFYAFNDFNRYQKTPFENQHEGDDEGCCLVFERNALNAAAESGSTEVLHAVPPHSIITSVHKEFQDADEHSFLPAGSNRDELALVVWIAAGSHATYLSGGEHDLVHWGDSYETMEEQLPFLPGVTQIVAAVLATIAVIVDHFVDTVDQTSDDGVRSGPDDVTGDHPAFVPAEVQMLHMSEARHIYEPADRNLLRLRAFSGKWGASSGNLDADDSPPFAAKTGRYFRRLLKALD